MDKAIAWASGGNGGDCIPLSYKVIVPSGQATVRSGPGRTFQIIDSIPSDPNKQHQVDCEKHGELISGDDVWSHLPDFNGYVTRSALQVVHLD